MKIEMPEKQFKAIQDLLFEAALQKCSAMSCAITNTPQAYASVSKALVKTLEAIDTQVRITVEAMAIKAWEDGAYDDGEAPDVIPDELPALITAKELDGLQRLVHAARMLEQADAQGIEVREATGYVIASVKNLDRSKRREVAAG